MKKSLLLLCLALLWLGVDARIRVNYFYPAQGTVKIKNVVNYAYDYNNFQISINGSYYNLSNLTTVSGNLNAGVNEEIEISGLSLPASGSIGLWYPSSLPGNASSGNLVDFLQYGSAGHEHEALAVTAGLWTAGEFITGMPPYMRTGGPNDEGAGFWQDSNMGLTHLAGNFQFEVYPNPAAHQLKVVPDATAAVGELNVAITDISGRLVKVVNLGQGINEIPLTDLRQGAYMLVFQNREGILERKYLLKK